MQVSSGGLIKLENAAFFVRELSLCWGVVLDVDVQASFLDRLNQSGCVSQNLGMLSFTFCDNPKIEADFKVDRCDDTIAVTTWSDMQTGREIKQLAGLMYRYNFSEST